MQPEAISRVFKAARMSLGGDSRLTEHRKALKGPFWANPEASSLRSHDVRFSAMDKKRQKAPKTRKVKSSPSTQTPSGLLQRSFYVPPEIWLEVTEVAFMEGRSASDVIREAIEQ